ncbi:MAG: hypothetical protein ABIA76_00900 [Candidatus Diapherotrites archaeon]
MNKLKLKMNKLSLILVIAGVLLIVLSAGANAECNGTCDLVNYIYDSDIIISAEETSLGLMPEGVISTLISVKNSGNEIKCMKLFADPNYVGLKAVLAETDICVAPNQARTFSLTVTAPKEIPSYPVIHTVKIFAMQESKVIAEKKVLVDIDGDKCFSLKQSYYKPVFELNGYSKEIPFTIKNLCEKTLRLELSADNEMFMPEFEENEMILNRSETRRTNLVIHINGTTPAGDYEAMVYGKSKDRKVQRYANFSLTENFHKKQLKIEVLDEFTEMKRGEEKLIRFKATNLMNEKQKIFFMANLTLGYEFLQESHEFEANESQVFYLKVKAKEFNENKQYKGILYAYNRNGEQDEDDFFVEINAEHDVTAELLEGNAKALICAINEKAIAELLVSNYGDFNEKIEIKINNPDYKTIEVKAAENKFTLDEDESRKVFIAIAPGTEAELGEHEFTATVYASGKFIKKFTINYIVVEEENTELEQGVIQITGFPTEVSLAQGEEKEMVFTITNTSKEKIKGITAAMKGLGYGTTASEEKISLAAGETKTVKLNLKAEKNAKIISFNAVIEIKSDEFIDSKPVKVIVLSKKETKEEGNEGALETAIAGLIGLGSSLGGGLMILILIIAIILIISLLKSDETKSNNRWIAYKKRRGMYA